MRKYSAKLSRSDKNWSTVKKKENSEKKERMRWMRLLLDYLLLPMIQFLFFSSREKWLHILRWYNFQAPYQTVNAFSSSLSRKYSDRKNRDISKTHTNIYISIHTCEFGVRELIRDALNYEKKKRKDVMSMDSVFSSSNRPFFMQFCSFYCYYHCCWCCSLVEFTT